MNKKNFLIPLIFLMLLLTLSACSNTPPGTEDSGTIENTNKTSEEVSENTTEEITEKDTTENTEADVVIEANKAVSMFSWYFELSNPYAFEQLSQPLEELEVTRIYQLFSADYLKEPQVPVMVHNLSQIGIETVLLTGDKSWVTDGLAEFQQTIDALSSYNENVGEEFRIHTVALDVEVHSLPGWKKNSKKLFRSYVELMKEAKSYANERNLRVIQIVPTFYDDVDSELFMEFLLYCCDELSIMNYNKKTSFSAIATEVDLCREYGIPVETLFETMPINKEYGVTESNTYYYDGIDVLKEDATKIKEAYGPTLGIGYHHFSTLYKMCTGNYLAEIYPQVSQTQQPGDLILMGDDGSLIVASPYWPTANVGEGKYCWLAIGVKENVEYTIQYYDMFQNVTLEEKLIFQAEESETKLNATISLP